MFGNNRVIGSFAALTVVSTILMCGSQSALAAGGTIVGKINFDGKMAPKDSKSNRINTGADAYCAKVRQDDPIFKERYIFNYEKATLCNVVVYISSELDEDYEASEDIVKIEQIGCQYVPHVVSVTTGQKMQFRNGDETLHNLNLKSVINPTFNEAQPAKEMVKEVSFKKPEFDPPISLQCAVHDWMGAYIAVFDHPFHAVSDENGEYKIENVPAGTYEISVWHEFDKFTPVKKTISVTVVDGEETTVDFTYQPPQPKK